jgi:hypothetical protein
MRHLNPRKAIVSAYVTRPGKISNFVRHADASCDLALVGIPFREVSGCYNGHHEQSYVCWPENAQHVRQLAVLALSWGQESWLEIHPDDTAELHFTDGRESIILGPWREVTAEEAADLDAYTYDEEHGRYFAAGGDR